MEERNMAQVQILDRFNEQTSCRVILQQTLFTKQQKNKRYSLRAFARDLKISPSFLSEVLNGKYGISKQLAAQIADRLGFNSEEVQHFCSLADLEVTDSRSKRRGDMHQSSSGQLQEMEISAQDEHMEIKIIDLQDNIRQLIRQSKTGTFMLHIRS
jgi:plasmid maintenance system antidote protein VapI